MIDYIINEKGEEVISERHQKDFKKENEFSDEDENNDDENKKNSSGSFTDIDFDDI
jgi:hypothetical protein